MPLMPKRVKYRKVQKGNTKGKACRGATMYFGDYGLQVLEPGRLKNNQIEAARIAITHHLKSKGKLWIRIFPDRPFTKKPAETRMGKGKGDVAGWEAIVLPGRIVFEIAGVEPDVALEALRLASYKMPVATRIIKRE
ncbi:MAG: 50S ribosomal protein L16 [Candidatus Omnitrophica bacterium]|nr:50S ribosomal protein L16 [Candidatus Omnitrophota bacterium]MCM8824872.1 50S ribosomal protein L16 [Candidatus Omnitrophota bacterium]